MVSFRRSLGMVAVGLLVAAVPVQAADSADYFPPDTQAVITINVKQILNSPLLKKDLPRIEAGLQGLGEAQEHLKALGFNPLKDLDTITLSGVGASDQEKGVVLVRGKFDVAKFKAQAAEHAKKHADDVKIHKAGENLIYEVALPNSPKPLFLGLLDDTTIVGSTEKATVEDAFAIKAGKKKVTLKKELKALMEKCDATKMSVAVVALGSALGTEVPNGDKINFITGGITLADNIQVEIAIEAKDADAAKGIKGMIDEGLNSVKGIVSLFAQQQKELAPLAEMLEVLKVDDKDKKVTIKGEVSKEAIEKLEKMK